MVSTVILGSRLVEKPPLCRGLIEQKCVYQDSQRGDFNGSRPSRYRWVMAEELLGFRVIS